ncbi:MAG: FAD-dependent oxidoreductase [Deltaproteobacteria bacterium]|nr:FAD-dependent oxidoreductase [Deltaproteobacteria bacterium]
MKHNYDIVIIGGGVMGLSLAYNLAKHNFGSIAVIEKSYIGSGASGRNGEMLRSAFGSEIWIQFFNRSLQLWETLSSELDFNVMFTRCGYLVLASSRKEFEVCRTNVNTQHTYDLKTELLDAKSVKKLIPALNPEMISGGAFQTNGGFARHDAVVWAYARASKRFKVNIFPYTEVTGIRIEHGAVKSVETSKGQIGTNMVVNAAGGHAGDIAGMVDLPLPSKTYRLEMIATEPLKPFLRPMLASLNTMSYMHQSTRGEFVGGAEIKNLKPAKSLKSTLVATQDMAGKFIKLFPGLASARLMRQWGGIVDMAPDLAPVLGPVKEIEGFILNCGWVYGFVGAPAAGELLAQYILTGKVPLEIQPFTIERFQKGEFIIDQSLVVPSEAENDGASV